MASALDSIFDVFVSLGNFAAVKFSQKEPNQAFPYGFGKIEGVAGQFQGFIIVVSGLSLAYFSIKKIFGEADIEHLSWGVIVMLISTVITWFLCDFLRREANRLDSVILRAEGEHYWSDVLANVAVLLGILAIWISQAAWIDGLISLLIAGIIIKTGVTVFIDAVSLLLDHRIGDEKNEQIRTLLEQTVKDKKISNFYFLRSRRSGSQRFVDFHLVFSPRTSLKRSHEISLEVEKAVKSIIGDGEVLIHLEPS